ncbi:unnamed protein product [Linum trigynum]|uniref:Uncharacterized protein n=1 Tax=Linum trigynum TaxID=586398 RepID=A0AAV2E7B6_9ROSI
MKESTKAEASPLEHAGAHTSKAKEIQRKFVPNTSLKGVLTRIGGVPCSLLELAHATSSRGAHIMTTMDK